MGVIEPQQYKNVIGKKIMFQGKEAIIDDFTSCYEGDYWLLKVEKNMPPFKYDFFTPEGTEIVKQVEELQRRMANGEKIKTCKHL